MKKIISLFLTLVMCFTSISVMAYSDTTPETSISIKVLSDLGILDGFEDGTFREDETLTRAQATKIMCVLLGYDNVSSGNTEFSDVTATHWASGYINMAQAAKIIAGMGNGTFAPEEAVTYEQIVKMAVCALGYEPAAKSMNKGNWYNGYINIASSLGILDGVKGAIGKNATRGQFADLIYNSLNIQLMDVERWTSDGHNEYSKTDETILSKYLEVEKWEGIVSKTPYIEYASGGDRAVLGLDEAELYKYDGKRESETFDEAYCDEDVEQYLGKKVICYVGENARDERVVYSIAEKADANETVVIKKADYDRTENGYVYYDKNNRTTKLNIAKEIMIVEDYDIFYGDIDDLELDAAKGNIIFISNNRDSEYDVVMYNTNATVAVVKDIEKYDDVIAFDTYLDGIEEYDPDEDVKIIVVRDDKKAEVKDIKVDDTVTIIDKDTFKLYFVSSKTIKGKVTSISGSDNEVSIDRKEYKYDSDYLSSSSFSLNDESTFYFSVDDMIVYADIADVAINKYGIVTRAYYDTGYDEYRVEVVFSNGQSGVYSVSSSKEDEIKTALNNLDGRVLYEDIQNYVFSISFREKDKTISRLKKADRGTMQSGKRYDAETMTYGSIDMYDSTAIFAVEGTVGEPVRVSDITTGYAKDYFTDDEGEEFTIYPFVERDNGYGILVGKNITGTVSNKNNVVIISSISNSYIDSVEDTGYIVRGLQGGKEVEYKLYDIDEKPAKGDIILVGAQKNGVIEKITILNRLADADTVDYDDQSSGKVRTVVGKVDREKTDGSRLYFDVDGVDNILLKSSASYTLVDNTTSRLSVEKKAKGISIFGSKEKYESYVFVRYYDDVQMDVVVYRYNKQ